MSAPATLADVVPNPHAFPRALIRRRCETALVLFAAGFHGANDAVWLAHAGVHATCVDTNAEKLAEMEAVYPAGWEFVNADAYEFADRADGVYDVVTADPWSNEFQRCADLAPRFCELARVAVLLGTGADTTVEVPDGWKVTETLWRTDYDGGVYWSVLERA